MFSFKSAQCVLSYLGYKYHGANIDTGDSRCTLEQGTISPRSSGPFYICSSLQYRIGHYFLDIKYDKRKLHKQYYKISGKF